MSDSNAYIAKDDITIGEPARGIAATRRELYSQLLHESRGAKHFMELAEKRDAKNFVLNHDRLQSFANKRWGEFLEPYVPEFGEDTFDRLPQSMIDWVNNDLRGNKSRPLNLIVVGGPELGKTNWARSLGPHEYWINRFNGKRTRGAVYAVLDDFDHLPNERAEFKGIWGVQRTIGIKVANGISGQRNWDWAIPSIWLYNELPNCLWNENCYERQRSVVVNIDNRLY